MTRYDEALGWIDDDATDDLVEEVLATIGRTQELVAQRIESLEALRERLDGLMATVKEALC